jgi:hypothetical protein
MNLQIFFHFIGQIRSDYFQFALVFTYKNNKIEIL